ncbi:MAG TPA: hypothetical protein VGB75_04935 [Jatrophihabitans sp.]|jgi:hypothetical protein|uniref:hypothetical protein n=1 Tax=Jatrophihabitans sp. TaxID=1932789 RepID=UPI002F20E97F
MTLDFDDQRLDDLLTRRGQHWQQDFTAPPLEGMLAVATSDPGHRLRRWVWPAVAAALLLVIPLITLLRAHHREHSAPARPDVQLVRPLGKAAWNGAVLQDDGRTVVVTHRFPEGSVRCDQGYPVLRAEITSQTADRVVISATAYESDQRPAPDSLICTEPGGRGELGDYPVAVVLDEPLGKRQLVDAADGRRHPVLAASTVPRATYLPAGFTDRGVHWSEATGVESYRRTYANSKGKFSISRGPYDASLFDRAPGPETVLGHPALYQYTGIFWRDGAYLWSIMQESYNGTGITQLDKAMLLKIGNSIR